MRKRLAEVEPDRSSVWYHLKNGLQAICLGSMVAGFATLGALGYQGWKLFHNPYHMPSKIAQAPSPEAAAWAAEVYRKEKHEHLFFTGLFEVALVALCAGTWVGYRRLDRKAQDSRRSRQQAPTSDAGPLNGPRDR